MTLAHPQTLVQLLACPRCAKPLAAGPPLRCEQCRVDFPDVGSVPWLFAEPAAALAEWRTRMHRLIRQWEVDAARTSRSLAATDLHPLTRARLERLVGAQSAHMGELARLLTPLNLGDIGAALETHLALRTRIAPTQGLTTYYANLHRDWCWGDAENAASFDLVARGLALADLSGGRILVLGSGAGRLAYDVHTRLAPAVTVALDVNPLLSLAARQLADGVRIELHEFPLAPRRLVDVAVRRELAAPAPVGPGFHCVLADALRAPFAADAFDAVVTPWFVDIVDEDLRVLAQRINRLLKPGGRWVTFGSLRFGQADPALCFSVDEATALIAAAGFSAPDVVEATIPYMCSPASRHGRTEQVLTISATKTRRVAAPPRHTALPEWLIQNNQPVPLLDSFRVQSTTTQVYAFIMSMIDGRRSLRDMATVMEERRLMPKAEAEAALRAFLIKMYDESRAPGQL
jgi:SAM-dependent methyltransferase